MKIRKIAFIAVLVIILTMFAGCAAECRTGCGDKADPKCAAEMCDSCCDYYAGLNGCRANH